MLADETTVDRHWWDWWGLDGKAEGPMGTWDSENGAGITYFTLKGYAYLLQGRGPGPEFFPGQYEYGIGANGSLSSTYSGDKGFGLHGVGRIGAWGSYTTHPTNLSDGGTGEGKVEAFAGGETNLDADVGPNGANLSAGAFAGGRLGVEDTYKHESDGISLATKVEGWAGYGAKAEQGLWRDDAGRIHIRAHGGAAFEFGGKLGVDVTIDPKKLFD